MVMTVLAFLGWSLFWLALLLGLALDLLGLFGNWVILGACAVAWALSGFAHFGPLSLFFMLLAAILGEVLETALAGYGAKKFGGSKGSIVAALVGALGGAVIGTPLFPIVGTLIGACVGAFGAAAFYDYVQHEKGVQASVMTGVGAAIGKVGGLFAKLGCGIAMLIIAYLAR
jgi:uncharacterized protein YqgC (DUF456 family)